MDFLQESIQKKGIQTNRYILISQVPAVNFKAIIRSKHKESRHKTD